MLSNGSNTKNFFEEQKIKSKIKTTIVTEFYRIYLPIINRSVGKNASELIYLDLFSGPGCFNDGTESTPLAFMNILFNMRDRNLATKVNLVFNDENTDFVNTLKSCIMKHPFYNEMQIKPTISNLKTNEFSLRPYLSKKVPIFSFIDPWGYKDITASLIWKLVKPIGSDCILFFNSNRILQDISKPTHNNDMHEIFGDECDNAVNVQKNCLMSQNQKAEELLKLFSKNLYNKVKIESNNYKLFVLPFTFMQDECIKTSHQIVLLTKNHKAVREMKRVMLKQSNNDAKDFIFDSKKIGMLSFFSREDDVRDNLGKLIICMLNDGSRLMYNVFTCEKLLEYIDRYSMSKYFKVTPYTVEDVKKQIEIFDNDKLIDIFGVEGKKIRKRITLDREFKFKSNILE